MTLNLEKTEIAVRVPAKAMLFGEYGVMLGGPAVVMTLSQESFVLAGSWQKATRLEMGSAEKDPIALRFSSDFFERELQVPLSWLQPDGGGEAACTKEEQFVLRVLQACSQVFPVPTLQDGRELHLRVVQSFSPSLGFGSSSALIAGIVHLFAALVGEKASSIRSAWPLLIAALRRAQGRGSGYDVAVQYVAAQWLNGPAEQLDLKPQLWVFRPCAQGDVPGLKQLENEHFWSRCGYFVPSNQWAPTAKILREQAKADLDHYGPLHAALAEEACDVLGQTDLWEDLDQHPLAPLMDASLALARSQGIADHVDALKLEDRNVVALKTMGAGCGDSVWVLPAEKSPAQRTNS